jgi:hypothetical protein
MLLFLFVYTSLKPHIQELEPSATGRFHYTPVLAAVRLLLLNMNFVNHLLLLCTCVVMYICHFILQVKCSLQLGL